MPVYRDYEIRINFNELIEEQMHVCDALHPDHCLTEEQIDHIAHHLRTNICLESIYQQVHSAIWEYCDGEGIDGVDPRPHYGDIEPKPGREAELTRREKAMKEFEMVDLVSPSWSIKVPRRRTK